MDLGGAGGRRRTWRTRGDQRRRPATKSCFWRPADRDSPAAATTGVRVQRGTRTRDGPAQTLWGAPPAWCELVFGATLGGDRGVWWRKNNVPPADDGLEVEPRLPGCPGPSAPRCCGDVPPADDGFWGTPDQKRPFLPAERRPSPRTRMIGYLAARRTFGSPGLLSAGDQCSRTVCRTIDRSRGSRYFTSSVERTPATTSAIHNRGSSADRM